MTDREITIQIVFEYVRQFRGTSYKDILKHIEDTTCDGEFDIGQSAAWTMMRSLYGMNDEKLDVLDRHAQALYDGLDKVVRMLKPMTALLSKILSGMILDARHVGKAWKSLFEVITTEDGDPRPNAFFRAVLPKELTDELFSGTIKTLDMDQVNVLRELRTEMVRMIDFIELELRILLGHYLHDKRVNVKKARVEE